MVRKRGPMKYQIKLTICYATIALVLSLILGIALYRISLGYETKRQEENIAMTSAQLVSQMDERLRRMDAIMYYILSDPDVLSGITILGRREDKNFSSTFLAQAEWEINVGLTTDYILKNSYRTVFFNQRGDLFSGYDGINPRLQAHSFEWSEIPYLEKAIKAKGKTVFIAAHPENWETAGNQMVYSTVKALQGYQMGFLEVENTVESLDTLEIADPDVNFLIFTEEREPVYASQGEFPEQNELEELLAQKQGASFSVCTSEVFDFTVAVYREKGTQENGRAAIFVTSFLAALATFTACLILIALWSYRLTRPIQELRSMMEQTNLENLDKQKNKMPANAHGLDEVEMLADSYRSMTERLSEARDREKRSVLLQMQAQFDTFQAQINPHFLYNVLNIISSRAVEDDDDMICDMCGALASMLRYSTNNKERYVTAEQELAYLDNYLFLLKARYEEKIHFQIQIDEEVRHQMLPKMTLQQFVENALCHGYNHSRARMEIQVIGKMAEDHWEICVQDNGEGMEKEQLEKIREKIGVMREMIEKHSGNTEQEIGNMGLVNTYARCFLLYNERLIFSIENLPRGVAVRIGEKLERKGEEDVPGHGGR